MSFPYRCVYAVSYNFLGLKQIITYILLRGSSRDHRKDFPRQSIQVYLSFKLLSNRSTVRTDYNLVIGPGFRHFG